LWRSSLEMGHAAAKSRLGNTADRSRGNGPGSCAYPEEQLCSRRVHQSGSFRFGESVRAVHPEELGFGKLFEMIRDGIIVAEAKTQRVVLWNSAATAIFGYSPEEALRLRVEDLVPERLKAPHRAGIARYHRTGRGRYTEANKVLDLPAVAKSGEEIRVELSLSPIGEEGGPAEENGSSSYVLAIVRDITERNRAEEFAAQLLRHLSGEALSDPDPPPPAVPPDPRVPLAEVRRVELTPREREALRLLASGKTNRQISQELLVSVSTVKGHVARIIAKLGVSDRTQAAVRAVELGLLAAQQPTQPH
jgi:PAS domain S-box-containing protein